MYYLFEGNRQPKWNVKCLLTAFCAIIILVIINTFSCNCLENLFWAICALTFLGPVSLVYFVSTPEFITHSNSFIFKSHKHKVSRWNPALQYSLVLPQVGLVQSIVFQRKGSPLIILCVGCGCVYVCACMYVVEIRITFTSKPEIH